MSKRIPIKIRISPFAVLLLAVFVFLSSPASLAAVLAAVMIHESGHSFALQACGGEVDGLEITAFGIQMHIKNAYSLSYGKEVLCVLAGPLSNLTLSWILGIVGRTWEEAYIFAGAQLVLGVFNLLPMSALDGGRVLWIFIAWVSDPYFADWVCKWVTLFFLLGLLGVGCTLWLRCKSFFLFVGIFGIFCCFARELGLVNWHRRR